MIGLTSSSSAVLRNAMFRHPSIMNKWNPQQYVVRTMSSVHTAQTSTSEHHHYGNDPTKIMMNDILMNQASPQQHHHHHGAWQGSSNHNSSKNVHSTIGTNVPPETHPHPTIPKHTTTTHRVRTHINSTATNPNGGHVMFPL